MTNPKIICLLLSKQHHCTQVDVARGRPRHPQDDQAPSDGWNALQELNAGTHEDAGIQGAILRQVRTVCFKENKIYFYSWNIVFNGSWEQKKTN